MAEDERRVAEGLDPAGYAAHVTRTALLLEQLARDVKALRDETGSSGEKATLLGRNFASLERDLAVYRVQTDGAIKTACDLLAELAEKQKWLSRLVIGALVTSVIGGIVALVFRAVA